MSHWYSTACLNNHLFLFFSQLFSRLSSFFPPISFSWQLQSSPLSFLSSLAFHFILLSHSLSSSLLFFLFFFSIGANPFNPPAFLPPFSCHIFARRRTVWIWVRVLKWSRDLFAKTPRTSEKQRYLPFPLSFRVLTAQYEAQKHICLRGWGSKSLSLWLLPSYILLPFSQDSKDMTQLKRKEKCFFFAWFLITCWTPPLSAGLPTRTARR